MADRTRSVWRRRMTTAGLAVWLLLPVACQQEMARQPSYKPLDPNTFFPDGRSARPLVPGTVARGHLRTDIHLFAARRTREHPDWTRPAAIVAATSGSPWSALGVAAVEPNNLVDTFPFPVTREVLQHGYNRYMIYCGVCHDPLGTGRGKIVERGYTEPPSFHIDRLRNIAVGHFYDVITNGYGSMPEYKAQIPPRDRWAIAAYIRALQLSQRFPARELTQEMRREYGSAVRQAAAGEVVP